MSECVAHIDDGEIRILLIGDDLEDTLRVDPSIDDPGNRYLLIHADHLTDGLERLGSEPYHVIILDLPQSASHDLDTLKTVRDHARDIPIIIVNGPDDEATVARAIACGAQDYLVKGELEGRAIPRTIRHAIEHHQLLRALEISERNFQNIISVSPNTMVIADGQGVVKFINPAGRLLFGDDADRLIGQPFPYPLEQNTSCEIEIEQEGHETAIVEIRTFGIEWDNDEALFICLYDITAHRSLENQFQQSQKMEAVGRLAGGVAHDFNNHLTVINGYAELIRDTLKERTLLASDFVTVGMDEILKAGHQASDLVNQLLAFSRKQILELKVLNLNTIITESTRMLRRLIGEDIELTTYLAANLRNVEVDPGQVQQILMNLAVNARDAMPHGGKLTIETSNKEMDEEYVQRHMGSTPGLYAMLSICDTGHGMDKETKARIFDPFYTTKEPGKGTGLGLSTVYGIVKQSNGYISVYSEPNRGTCFKIFLPKAESKPVVEKPVQVSDNELPTGSETILLVEDEGEVRRVMQTMLSRQGYTVVEAPDGKDALRFCELFHGKIDLVVTDVVMPGMSGRELTDRLMKLRPEIKTLYISGYTDEAIVHHGVLDQGTAFLQKPFISPMLLRKVRDVLDDIPV